MHEERLKNIVLQEAYRTITVQDAECSATIPMAQAVIRAMAVNAAKGQHRAQRRFSELLASTENSRKRLHDEYFEGALTYKIEWRLSGTNLTWAAAAIADAAFPRLCSESCLAVPQFKPKRELEEAH